MRKRSNVKAFESSVEKLSRILSKKWDIKVVFGSAVPITTGKVIYLPTIPEDASQDFLTVVQGHLDHETAHVLFTDFDALQTIIHEDKKLYLLVNGLEDSRIEREYCEVWRGAYSNLKKSLEWALIKMVEPYNKSNRFEQLKGISKLIYTITVLPQLDFDEEHWFIKEHVPADILARVNAVKPLIEQAIERGGNTAKVIDIAKQIMEIWMKDEPEDKTPPPQLPPPPPSDMTPQEAKDELMPPQLPPPPPLPVMPAPLPKVVIELVDIQEYENKTSRAQMIKDEIDNTIQDNPPKYAVYTTAGDVVETICDGDKAVYKQFTNNINHMVGVIKKKMSRSLLSTGTSGWETGKLRGRLDSRAAYKVAVGTSSRVFKERVQGISYDTAVMLMVDHSGSMCGERLKLATQTSIIMGEVLQGIGIPFSIVGFSTGESGIAVSRKMRASEQDNNLYTRWGNLWLGVYKDFDDQWYGVNHRLVNMPSNGHSNTYDGETLRWGAKQLLNRPEKRKILFWLNDGEPAPNNGDNMPAHIAYTAQSAKDVESVIELIAVGIYSSNVKRYYSNYIVVGNLEDLPKLCINELDALLRKTKGDKHGRRQ